MTLDHFLTEIWAELGDFTRPRGGYPGLVALATSGVQGPEVRQLVLRAADKASSRLILNTDSATPKCVEIGADPSVSLLVWREETRLQIRAKGRAEILGAYAAQQAWADLPFAGRGNYGVDPVPGSVIETADAYERTPDPARLAVLSVVLAEIDAVLLSEPRHMRARFRAADQWSGQWLAP